MGLHQASFRIRHECPYRELSEQYPDLTIREWYVSECQVLDVSTTNGPTAALIGDLERLGTIEHQSMTSRGLTVVMKSCECSLEDSLIQRFEDHDCLYQPPTVHRHGWEHYTVLAFDEAAIRSAFEALEADREIEVLSKTGVEALDGPQQQFAPVDQLFAGVTDRQLDALRLALDRGYYEQPRGASIDELAADTSVARSTFEEHLRKAENKVLTNAGQFVRLRAGAKGGDSLGAPASTIASIARSD